MNRRLKQKGKVGRSMHVILDDKQRETINHMGEMLGMSRSAILGDLIPSPAMAEMLTDMQMSRKLRPGYFIEMALAYFIRSQLTEPNLGKNRVHPDNLPNPLDADGHAKMMVIFRRCHSKDEPGYKMIPCEWPDEKGGGKTRQGYRYIEVEEELTLARRMVEAGEEIEAIITDEPEPKPEDQTTE